MSYQIRNSETDGKVKLKLLEQLVDGLSISKKQFENPKFKDTIKVLIGERIGNYYQKLDSLFYSKKIDSQLVKLKNTYCESDELQSLTGSLRKEHLNLTTLSGLHSFHRNYTQYKKRQYQERYKEAQIIYQTYLWEVQVSGVFIYLIFTLGLGVILFFIRQLSLNTKRDLKLTKDFRNEVGVELGVVLVVSLLLLIPLLRAIKPENIDPEKPYWMMTLKNWYTPGNTDTKFFPIDFERTEKEEGRIESRLLQMDNEIDYSESLNLILAQLKTANEQLQKIDQLTEPVTNYLIDDGHE